MSEYVQLILDETDREFNARVEEHETRTSRDIDSKIEDGSCIANVSIEFVDATILPAGAVHGSDEEMAMITTAIAKFDMNDSKFRIGDLVNLSGHGINQKLSITSINTDTATLITGPDNSTFISVIPPSLIKSDNWCIEETQLDLRDRLKGGIRKINKNQPLLDLLTNRGSGVKYSPISSSNNTPSILDSSQLASFQMGCSESPISSIIGPPGTGKTFLLSHIIANYVTMGKRVLVTAMTHTAINNVLLKCAKLINPSQIYKIGDILNQPVNSKTQIQNINSSEQLSEKGVGLVAGATCYQINKSLMHSKKWDVLIIDEASQMSAIQGLSVLAIANKYILCGDRNQLGPIFPGNLNQSDFTCSILDYTSKLGPESVLDTTYRMNSEILKFPNSEFYANQLTSSKEAQNRSISYFADEESLNTSSKLITTKDNSWNDEIEAALAVSIIQQYISKGLPPSEIGVIAPFRKLVTLIQNKINALDNDAFSDLKIDTVERFQGQEKSLIIFALGISSEEKLTNKLDFVLDPKRFNVAITRAKMKRITLCSPLLVNKSKETNNNVSLQLLKRFIESENVAYV